MLELLKAFVYKTDWMKTFVGTAFTLLFMFSVHYILMSPIPDANREIAHFIAGEVSGVALTIATYYYGSSKGSQEKTEMIKKQNEKTTL